MMPNETSTCMGLNITLRRQIHHYQANTYLSPASITMLIFAYTKNLT